MSHDYTPPSYYSSTPPAPPPKRTAGFEGPPLPPPPPNQANGPSELEAYPVRQHAQAQVDVPVIEGTWLPESLKEKSTSDLHQFLSTPEMQTAILSDPRTTHPAIPATEAHLEPLIHANLSLANAVVEREAQLRELRERTQSRLLALRALEQQHRSKISETEAALKDFSPKALYQRLNASVQEQEQLVAGLEQSWLDEDGVASDREVSDFVRRVREARKVAFLRRERKDRWDKGRVGGWR